MKFTPSLSSNKNNALQTSKNETASPSQNLQNNKSLKNLARGFTHLHVHSHYSLLDGLSKIDDLLDRAKELGMDSLALTDHGVMYGAIEFYKKAKERGIKPIIGIELYMAPNGMRNKRPKIDDKRHHIILLAKNNIGYKNLIKLATLAHLEGFYYKPRIDKEVLKKYSNGLIGMSACIGGEVPKLAINKKIDEAEKAAREYEQIFGKENFYLEIGHHPGLPEQNIANKALIAIGKKTGIGLVATNDIHYLTKEDKEAQDILMAVQTKSNVEAKDRLTMKADDFSMKPPKEIMNDFKDIPEALNNTQKIADLCNIEIELGKTQLPHFEVPDRMTADNYLKKLCSEGLERKYGISISSNPKSPLSAGSRQNAGQILNSPPTADPAKWRDKFQNSNKITERLQYELSVIKQMGFAPYFLIVQDFVNWAKNNEIVVGPGRGSAAGSIVSYLLNITTIDPLSYNLLFERFLNPARISMPDIDLDFADTRRDEVINYVAKKYGQDHVAQIITFGTMAARAAVRDTGRALNFPYSFCDRIAKMIPMFTTLGKALETVNELKQAYDTDPDVKKLIEAAKKLEGVVRHASTHACGIVITEKKLENYTPLQRAPQNEKSIVTQYEMHSIEDLGLLKIDFLGLKNLTIIETAIQIIKNAKEEISDFNKIPLDDKKTFKLFQEGNTTGIFQYESGGMKRNLRALKPTIFEDLIAMNALYRPGPMEHIPEYINAKHGRAKIVYLHPKMESILKNTYGVIVYQEQVFEIAKQLAGFTYGEADILRKAVGKKIKKLLDEQKVKLISGMVKNSIDKNTAEKIWNFIEPFARYGFNKSHSVCYAMIGYQTAYLKAHYPTEFMAALMNSEQNDVERIAQLIKECNEMGITVLPPDINESFSNFTVVNDTQIRFGLAAIKNVGENIVKIIIEERKANGQFKSLENFIIRVESRDLNKKSLESLIKCGAIDAFGERQILLENIENILKFGKDSQKAKNYGQYSLFDATPGAAPISLLRLKETAPASKNEKLIWEKELLGLYISEHPLKEFQHILNQIDMIRNIRTKQNGNVVCAGIINKIKKINTRQNQAMIFVEIEDLTGRMEVIVFPRTLESNPLVWQNDKIIIIEGSMNDKDGVPKIIANKACFIEDYIQSPKNFPDRDKHDEKYFTSQSQEANKKTIQSINIALPEKLNNSLMKEVQKIFSECVLGGTQVTISIPNGGQKSDTIETPYKIKYDKSIIDKLNALGIMNIKIK